MTEAKDLVEKFEDYFTKKGIEFERGKSGGSSFVSAKLADIKSKGNKRTVEAMISFGRFTKTAKDDVWEISGGDPSRYPQKETKPVAKKAAKKVKKGAVKKTAPKPSDHADMPDTPIKDLVETQTEMPMQIAHNIVAEYGYKVASCRLVSNNKFDMQLSSHPTGSELHKFKLACSKHNLKVKLIRDKQTNIISIIGSVNGGMI